MKIAIARILGGGALCALGLFGSSASALPDVCYTPHLQNGGWQAQVCDGTMAGTVGQSRRMEAIRIENPKQSGGTICYQAHVQNQGWTPWTCNNGVAGTTGASLRMEALVITWSNAPTGRSLKFRGHIANFGWQSIGSSGAMIGNTGQNLSIEALEVNIQRPGATLYWQ